MVDPFVFSMIHAHLAGHVNAPHVIRTLSEVLRATRPHHFVGARKAALDTWLSDAVTGLSQPHADPADTIARISDALNDPK